MVLQSQAAVDDVGVVADWHAARTQTAARQALYAATRARSLAWHDSDGSRSNRDSWRTTRQTTPYRVLSATGVHDDYYTNALSWGRRRVALLLRDCLLLFPHDEPRQCAVAACTPSRHDLLATHTRHNDDSDKNSDDDDDDDVIRTVTTTRLFATTAATVAATTANATTAATTTADAPRRPTSVAMSRFSDEACFVGLCDGGVELYALREDGALVCCNAYCLPTHAPSALCHAYAATSSLLSQQQQRPCSEQHDVAATTTTRTSARPAVAALSTSLSSAAMPLPSAREAATMAVLRRARDTMARLAHTTTSVACLTTCNAHPWLVFAGTAARGVVALDARQRCGRPCLHFGKDYDESSGGCATTTTSATALCRAAADALRARERVCALSCNASGASVAAAAGVGDASVVRVWSLSQPRCPVHVLQSPAQPSSSTTTTTHAVTTSRAASLTGHASSVAASSSLSPQRALKALCCHPHDRHELAVGWSSGGDASLCVYDVASATPTLTYASSSVTTPLLPSCAPMMQVVYAPDGSHLVSSHDHTTTTRSRTLRAPSHALVMWGRRRHQQQQHRCACRGDASMTAIDDDDDDDDDDSMACKYGGSSRSMCHAVTSCRALVPLYSMPGHRARPLHLTTPFAQSDYAGCVASLSCGGADKTLRFWRAFAPCDAHRAWQQRVHAQQQSATCDTDVLVGSAPSLR